MNMQCKDATPLLAAQADGQPLAPDQAQALDHHLQGCNACRARLREQRDISAALRRHAPRYRLPEGLRARLHASLPAQTPPRPAWWQTIVGAGPFAGLRLGGAFAAGTALALGLQFFAGPSVHDDRLADEVVSGHVRSLMGQHLADIDSSDHHTVKPWFTGKLDFSPPVTDLAAQGYPLTGGRLDYLDSHAVAALVYRHGPHVINLFVWPASQRESSLPTAGMVKGYNLLHWRHGGMNYWAISDLNAAELETFALALGANV